METAERLGVKLFVLQKMDEIEENHTCMNIYIISDNSALQNDFLLEQRLLYMYDSIPWIHNP